jgi:ACS family tartrate transporter-like MFS transporter
VENIEKRAMRRAMWRLVPLLCLCYFIAYLDRVNAGFAKLQMNTSLGLDDSMFGLGAGLFFIAYFLLGVPSNLALDRVGARRWIACIMIAWGTVSACFAFLQPIGRAIGLSNEYAFYLFRFLLGMAEAGFFPGVVLFLTQWFPALYRARIIGLFTLAAPFSSMLGAPLSGALLNVTGSGLAGWQWLFLLEGVPAILMAFVVLGYLTDGPDKAAWLAADERQWLIVHLDSEHDLKEKVGQPGFLKTISDTRILALAVVYFSLGGMSYGVSFFLPTIVKTFGLSYFHTGIVTAVPFVFGAAGMLLLTRHSDKTGERKRHVAFALFVTALGAAMSVLFDDPVLKIACFCVSQIGISSLPPLFWTLPASFLTGTGAATGIAAINSLGNLSSFLGPYILGYSKNKTGSFSIGLLILAGVSAIGALIAVSLRHDRAREEG